MNTFQCPGCGHANILGSASCESCLLIFEKHNKRQAGETLIVHGGAKLETLWQDVLRQYESIACHETFIQQALIEKKLPFASQQYRKIIETSPHDEMALKMRDKIIQLAMVTFAMPGRVRVPSQNRAFRNIFLVILTMIIVFIVFTLFNLKK